MILFHGTTEQRYNQMLVDGAIIPNASPGGILLIRKGNQLPDEGYVYFTDDYDTAEWYARGINNHFVKKDKIVVLEVEIDKESVLPDPLESTAITGLKSLEESGHCRVKGHVSLSQVTNIYRAP